MNRLAMPLRLALRELRSGLQGFGIFLACLILGVAAIATVGALTAAIERGIDEQGQPLLGGDVEVSLVHRDLTGDEAAFLAGAGRRSTVAALRAMAAGGDASTLVEIKAVDAAYPLYGTIELDGGGGLADALAVRDGTPGAAVEVALLDRLGIRLGDAIRVGERDFAVRAVIDREPDRVTDGFILGPRVMIAAQELDATGLVKPGSLVIWRHRVALADDSAAAVRRVMTEAKERFPDAGWRLRSRDNAAPQVERFIGRLSFFLTLVGLTALIVGGVGIANAVKSFLERHTRNIATLKCLGSPASTIFATYLIEVGLVASLGIAVGIAVGMAAPPLAAWGFGDLLPVPVAVGIEPAPLLRAAAFGFLVTLAFSIWPLARAREVPASALFRDLVEPAPDRPRFGYVLVTAAALVAIAVLALDAFPDRDITLWYFLGLAFSFTLLAGLARLLMAAAARWRPPASAPVRLAVANLHRAGAATPSAVLSLGLGLTLFVTLALIDANLSREIRDNLPDKAPSFFFLDVHSTDRDRFVAALEAAPGVTAIGTAPMLRGRITRVKGVPVDQVRPHPDAAWAIRGDRGLTYSPTLPAGSRLVAGEWWPPDHAGPPLVSFSSDIATGLGLAIGDTVAVNVLGREIEARVANLRAVDWRTLQINFVMVFSPDALAGAPHMHIVTVEAAERDEPQLLRDMSRAFPTVTAVRVRDALDAVNDLLGKLLAAVRGANSITLLIGVLVLAGALATGLSARIYDVVVLKTYGASRRQLMTALVTEYALLGLVTAVFAVAAGAIAAWAVVTFVMEMPWRFFPLAAAGTALAAMAATVLAGLMTTWRALKARPARVLRTA